MSDSASESRDTRILPWARCSRHKSSMTRTAGDDEDEDEDGDGFSTSACPPPPPGKPGAWMTDDACLSSLPSSSSSLLWSGEIEGVWAARHPPSPGRGKRITSRKVQGSWPSPFGASCFSFPFLASFLVLVVVGASSSPFRPLGLLLSRARALSLSLSLGPCAVDTGAAAAAAPAATQRPLLPLPFALLPRVGRFLRPEGKAQRAYTHARTHAQHARTGPRKSDSLILLPS